ncbi:MAG: N-acetyltransferase family protein [Velocimicrobium sp.]
MNITIRLGEEADIDELEQLYNSLNDYLSATTNYPGWKKDVYPIRETAVDGISERCLYVAICNGKIVGSIILRHEPEPAYLPVKWRNELDYEEVFVIYTFVVHPDYLGQGIGQAMLDFTSNIGNQLNIKSLRLDVYENNLPAICLYEKCGFEYIDTVDLGLSQYNLDWFRLYEKLL